MGRVFSEKMNRWYPTGSDHYMHGREHTLEAKEKISAVTKGRKPRLGMPHTEESKDKMRMAKLGNPAPWKRGTTMSPELKEKLRILNTGKEQSEETKRKKSVALKGKYMGKDHPMYGRTHTPEVRAEISRCAKAHWDDPEYKQRVVKMAHL